MNHLWSEEKSKLAAAVIRYGLPDGNNEVLEAALAYIFYLENKILAEEEPQQDRLQKIEAFIWDLINVKTGIEGQLYTHIFDNLARHLETKKRQFVKEFGKINEYPPN